MDDLNLGQDLVICFETVIAKEARNWCGL